MKEIPDWLGEALNHFKSIMDGSRVLDASEVLSEYSRDYTEDLEFLPHLVLRPESTEEVSKILGYCNDREIPVTPAGARTGLSGGALPVEGGVSLSLERMNRIVQIDKKNFQATVEPGVITQVFQEAVAREGLFYPPDPASRGSCFIGGNLAESSGGPRAVKYGTTRDYVLNLEVVLADGSVIWTGANTLKNATGYNLTQLMVGSEGTLGIITKAVFRLIPHPKQDVLMLVPFRSAREACKAVSEILLEGNNPSALEFMERNALDWVMKFEDVSIQIEDDIEAHLLIEVDGNDLDRLMKESEAIVNVLDRFDHGEVLFAQDAAQKDKLWFMRRKVGEAVKAHSIYKEEDTVVPRFRLPDLLEGVKEIGNRYGFESVCYGHAGDGNLHVNVIRGELSEEEWNTTVKKGIREIFELTHELGGTISGEHGIGWVQREYLDVVFGKVEMDLMRGIKKAFDPKGILNPGKILPD